MNSPLVYVLSEGKRQVHKLTTGLIISYMVIIVVHRERQRTDRQQDVRNIHLGKKSKSGLMDQNMGNDWIKLNVLQDLEIGADIKPY